MNDVTFEAELQNTFLTEAEEMLEDTESSFITIESDPHDSTKIDKIFRLLHTIKGSAHVAGFAELGHFAHTFETLLGALRDKQLAISPGIIDILLEGNDRLKDFVRLLRADPKAHFDVTATANRISACLNKPATASVKKPQPDAQAATILVIDDEPDILEIFADTLQGAGFGVLVAESVQEGLDLLKTHEVAAIFTDLQMPGMTGIDLITAVRSNNEFLPIAVVSGHSSREHFKRYLEMGVDGFIDKPCMPRDIEAMAHRLLHVSQLRASMLDISKLSFQIYVTIEKLLARYPIDKSDKDRMALSRYMASLEAATNRLLTSERERKTIRGKLQAV